MKKMTRKGIPFHITRSFLTDSLCVLMGTAVLAFSIRAVFDPMSMVTGGFSGIAILASFISGGRIPLWLTNLVLNAPLFLIAWQQKEWGLLRQSILGAAALTVWLKVIPEIPFISGIHVPNPAGGGHLRRYGYAGYVAAQEAAGGYLGGQDPAMD